VSLNPKRLALAVVAMALASLAAGPARADLRYRVVLLRPQVTDDVTSDALTRVRGELAAGGFDVSMLPHDPALEVRAALETVGRELDPIATFAIVRAAGGNTAEIWVCDRLEGKSVIQSVRLDGSGATGDASPSVVLAVQAVELLKASLAQYWLSSTRQPAARTRTPAGPAAPPAYATTGIGVEAGIGWLDSAGAVTGAWQPILRASWGGAHGWGVRLAAAGFGSEASLHAPLGTAQIRQQLATAEIVRGFRAGHLVQPVASLGAGAYGARIEGVAAPGSTGVTTDSWSALVTAGAGVVLPLASHVALAADAHILVAVPYTAVRFGSVEAGNTGWPSLLVSAGLLATF
jgi:hypothetical protein